MARQISTSQIHNQICQVQRKYKQALRQHNYGKLRPYLNKVALPDSPGRCTTKINPLIPCKNIKRHFLPWTLRRKETMGFTMQGVTSYQIPRAELKAINVLPAILLYRMFGGRA